LDGLFTSLSIYFKFIHLHTVFEGSAMLEITKLLLRKYYFKLHRELYPDGRLLWLCDDPSTHGVTSEDWKNWSDLNNIKIQPGPNNGSIYFSPLDLEVFGVEEKLTLKMQEAVAQVYASPDNLVLNPAKQETVASKTDTRSPLERAR
jgi:hypothetical protein